MSDATERRMGDLGDDDPELGEDGLEEDDEEATYSIHHLAAVIRPVGLTMILASIAVAKIRDPMTDQALSNGLSNYLVYNEGANTPSSSSAFGQALINAIVIVSVIAAATFLLVACYYFRCIKVMVAYLIFASINLLGYTGGFMAYSAIQLWHIRVDWVTLAFIMYNFAIGGVISVFWQKGIPRVVTQGYLVAVSVIMAWMLTKLPEWTSWILLVVLALYDLCAVLTPCGPLRALIKLAQVRKDPIPGLLYEANVGDAPEDGVRDSFVTAAPPPPPLQSQPPPEPQPAAASGRGSAKPGVTVVKPRAASGGGSVQVTNPSVVATGSRSARGSEAEMVTPSKPAPAGSGNSVEERVHRQSASHASIDVPRDAFVDTAQDQQAAEGEGLQQEEEEEEEESPGERSIKLGLGDFVFYSVLVSRAALFDVATMVACFVSIIMGLGGTLFLLSVYKKALPALPISIFLGVAFYFLTRLVVTPMIVELSLSGAGI